MSAPEGRRRADRGAVPEIDQARWDASRRVNRRRTAWVIAAFVVGLIAIGLQVRSNVLDGQQTERREREQRAAMARTEARDRDRDSARLYQSCRQRYRSTLAQNGTNRILRSALRTSRNRMLLQAQRTTDPVLAARYRANAAKFAQDRRDVTFAVVPDCRETYPDWRRLSREYPGIVRVLKTPDGSSR